MLQNSRLKAAGFCFQIAFVSLAVRLYGRFVSQRYIFLNKAHLPAFSSKILDTIQSFSQRVSKG